MMERHSSEALPLMGDDTNGMSVSKEEEDAKGRKKNNNSCSTTPNANHVTVLLCVQLLAIVVLCIVALSIRSEAVKVSEHMRTVGTLLKDPAAVAKAVRQMMMHSKQQMGGNHSEKVGRFCGKDDSNDDSAEVCVSRDVVVLLHGLQQLSDGATGYYLFGAEEDGTVTRFVMDVLGYEYGSLANTISMDIQGIFHGTVPHCAVGAGLQGCTIAPILYTFLMLVQAEAEVFATWAQIDNPTATSQKQFNPAFSGRGLLSFDSLVRWIDDQRLPLGDWHTTQSVCIQMMKRINAVSMESICLQLSGKNCYLQESVEKWTSEIENVCSLFK